MDGAGCERCRELEARIAQLEALVAEQAALIAQLRDQLNRNSRNSSKPPSSDYLRAKPAPRQPKSKRRRGGQPGHQRATRPLAPPGRVTRVIDHRPPTCGACGTALAGDDASPRRHQVAELPPIEPEIDEHRLHRLCCGRCGRWTRAKLPDGVPRGHFGPRLTALLGLYSGVYRIGKRPLKQLMADVFGLTLSTGMICKLQRQTAAALEPTVAEMAAFVKTQNVNIDETGWRENRRRAVLWTAVAPLVSVFHIAASRAAQVAKQLLGEDFSMTAMCDRYKGYLWIRNVQLCWAHLRRDFQAMIDRGGAAAPIGEELLALSTAVFEWWHRVRDGTVTRRTLQYHLRYLREEIRAHLELGAACGCAKTAGVCRNILDREPQLWTFARTPGVEPTNNAAERTLRHAVIWRRSCFGTDSAVGSRFVERILSVVATCRQQRKNVLDLLTQAIVAQRNRHAGPSLLPSVQKAHAA